MEHRDVVIINESGMDGPACERLAQLAGKFQCDISVARNSRTVNAKSIMGLMMLVASKGSVLSLTADGPDEADAVNAVEALIVNGFEGKSPA
jgi:phosphocarrier protein HPr